MKLKRATTYNVNAISVTLIVLGILAVINFIGVRHFTRLDFTKQKLFSLSPQSVKVVKSLTQKVHIVGFFKADEKPLFDDLVQKYKYQGDKVTSQFVDPDKEVALAKQYNVKRYRTIIVEKGKRESRVEGFSEENAEEKITNAIIKVGKEKLPTLYFSTGHEEKSIKDSDRSGYSVANDRLKDEGYQIKELSLLQSGAIPADCDVLIIAGPEKPFHPKEVSLIESYVDKGGRLLALLDPTKSNTNLEKTFRKIGVTVENNIVIDPISTLFGQGAATPVISNYSKHAIVKDLKLASFYPMSRSLTIDKKQPEGVKVAALASSSKNSWGETGSIKRSKKVRFDQGKDKKGPLHIGVAAEKGEMRLALYGDSDFANNRSFGFSGNGNLFLNTLAWLTEDESAISIRPQTASMGRLMMTPTQVRILFSITVVILPLLIMGSGILVWWRRRKLA